MKDFQRNKCYSWEDLHVHQRIKSHIEYDRAQDLVNYIWEKEGLEYPPKIQKLSKNAKTLQAKGSRLKIFIPHTGIQLTILLHELAHSLTSTHDGHSAGHNGRFVGVFMALLVEYAGFNLFELQYTARSAGVEFNQKGKVI